MKTRAKILTTVSILLLVSSLGFLGVRSTGDTSSELLYYEELMKAFNLTEDELSLLDQNEFIVLNRLGTDDILDAYAYYWNHDLPVFITSDTLLQLWHLIFDKINSKLETDILYPLLSSYIESLIEELEPSFSTSTSLATTHTALYLYTAARLVNESYTVPSEFSSDVGTIYQTIMSEKTIFEVVSLFSEQPLSRFIDDFSQYKPRGHYDATPVLQSYFRIFKWLSRIPFMLDSYLGQNILKTSPDDMLYSAIELTFATKNGLVKLPNNADETIGLEFWNYFDDFLNKLIGKSFYNSPQFLDDYLTSKFGSWDLEILTTENIGELREDLISDPGVVQPMDPEIVDAITSECAPGLSYGEPSCSPPSFHILGERLGLDAFSLNHYVFPYTANYFPNGLQVAATLMDSQRAEDYLDESGHTSPDQIQSVKNENEAWINANTDTLSTTWFNSLSELTVNQPSTESTHYPEFMNTGAWMDEKLTTVLGSWAQYRHDTILYGRISYTSIGCSTPDVYVEPYPNLYRSLKELNSLYNTLLESVSELGFDLDSWYYYDIDEYRGIHYFENTPFDVLDSFNDILTNLIQAAEYQLEGKQLPQDLFDFLTTIYRVDSYDGHLWGWLSDLIALVSTGTTGGDYVNNYPDTRASTIADVHTDLNTRQNLHVGSGYMEHLIAKVPNQNGSEMLAIGPVFSYYEFLTPMNTRLADGEWRAILSSGNDTGKSLIPRGFWAESYMVSTDMTESHIYLEYPMIAPEWYIESTEGIIANNYAENFNIQLISTSNQDRNGGGTVFETITVSGNSYLGWLFSPFIVAISLVMLYNTKRRK